MIIRVYKVNKELPECLIHDSLECNNIWDIDPGIYRFVNCMEIKYQKVNELLETLEYEGLENINFEKSDIIEMLPDSEMLNNSDLDIENDCNFLILTGLGWEQIAIDKEAVFRELSLKRLYELFEMK